MEIYHVSTQADYDALMIELSKKGVTTAGGMNLEDWNIWGNFEEETCVCVSGFGASVGSKTYVSNSYPHVPIFKYQYSALEWVGRQVKKYDAWKMTQSAARCFDEAPDLFDKPNPDMVKKPKHYQNKSGTDLYQKWYEEHDMPTFRAIMRAIAERYTSRYENKNGIEDLEKGIYTLSRLKEYEGEIK